MMPGEQEPKEKKRKRKGNAALLVNRVPEDDSVDPAVNGIE